MAKNVDRVVEDIDKSMRALRKAARGIPFRAGGFRNTHHRLTIDVAHLMVLVDSARGSFNNR